MNTEQTEMKKLFDFSYIKEIRNNKNNKSSGWLNFIAFFIPFWGIFAIFYYLVKAPKKSKGILKAVIFSLLFQVLFFVICKIFLFDILSDLCITWIG